MGSEQQDDPPVEGGPGQGEPVEQSPPAPANPSPVAAPAAVWPAPPPPLGRAHNRGGQVLRVLVGAGVTFLVMSLLYGLDNAIMLTGLAVICTAGLSLILIIPGCWLVGWVTIAVWEAIARQLASRTAH
jgi:hypothetical protein